MSICPPTTAPKCLTDTPCLRKYNSVPLNIYSTEHCVVMSNNCLLYFVFRQGNIKNIFLAIWSVITRELWLAKAIGKCFNEQGSIWACQYTVISSDKTGNHSNRVCLCTSHIEFLRMNMSQPMMPLSSMWKSHRRVYTRSESIYYLWLKYLLAFSNIKCISVSWFT